MSPLTSQRPRYHSSTPQPRSHIPENDLFKTQERVNTIAQAENFKGVVLTTSMTAPSTALAASDSTSAPPPAPAPGFQDRKRYLILFLLYT